VKQPFNVETFLATVNGGRSISKYRKNQTVFRQGDLADSVFFIREGKVKVCVVSEQGKEAVVAIHGKGDFFGEGCLTGQPRRLATVTSMTEGSVQNLSHIWSGDGFGLRDLRLIERPHVHVALG
jgi:CRP/FNR family transcriptional regulator, cyclic AMP receptor protein